MMVRMPVLLVKQSILVMGGASLGWPDASVDERVEEREFWQDLEQTVVYGNR